MRPSLLMRMARGGAGWLGLLVGAAGPAWGQAEGSKSGEAPPPVRADAPATDPAATVTEAPPVDDFVVLPLRAHVLAAPDLPAADCHLGDADIRRVVGKVNTIWHRAGVHWDLGPIVREPAARPEEYRAGRAEPGGNRLGLLRLLAPEGSRSEVGMDVYYVHAFEANGVFLGGRTAFVQEVARLRAVPGGIDEPLPRVTAHELGHALGLDHRQDRTNLLASGTTGTTFNRAEVDRARRRAARFPGALTVPEVRRQLAEAREKGDLAAADRLAAILAALPVAAPTPAEPAAPVPPAPSPAEPG